MRYAAKSSTPKLPPIDFSGFRSEFPTTLMGIPGTGIGKSLYNSIKDGARNPPPHDPLNFKPESKEYMALTRGLKYPSISLILSYLPPTVKVKFFIKFVSN